VIKCRSPAGPSCVCDSTISRPVAATVLDVMTSVTANTQQKMTIGLQQSSAYRREKTAEVRTVWSLIEVSSENVEILLDDAAFVVK